jgi:hypothetical protein
VTADQNEKDDASLVEFSFPSDEAAEGETEN